MFKRRVVIVVVFSLATFLSFFISSTVLLAQGNISIPSPTPTELPSPSPEPTPRPDLTQITEETVGPLEKLLREQVVGPAWPLNPIKHAIRGSVDAGVPTNTIVLLLLLPFVAMIIAAARHVVGLRGFGIFLPAALSVVFLSTGPIMGILLFLVIVTFSTLMRIMMRRASIKLQYLPRMALMLWFVVLGVLGILFLAPVVNRPELSNVSIFSVLILVLLAEDFSKVQLGKSAKVAVNLTTETLILALVSYAFLTFEGLQNYALLNPESYLLLVAFANYLLGKYVGLRLAEYWRFRKLITS